MKQTLSLSNVVGKSGEEKACVFLQEKGYRIIIQNYLKPWGEIDIVAKKLDKIHFVEVKSVSVDAHSFHLKKSNYRPEENVHYSKITKLRRVIQTYLLERTSEGQEWQFDIVTVTFDREMKVLEVDHLPDIIL